MYIDKTKNISQVKEEFQSQYPGLKIEFYNCEHQANEGTENRYLIDSQTVLADANKDLISSEIDISGEKKVIEVEKEFKDKFGLHVQIFRRSNDLWLQTTVTDEWSLNIQNRKGIHSMEAYKVSDNET